MAKAATLTIDIVADVAKATKNLEKIDGKLSTFGKAFTGAAIAGGAAVVGGALLGLGKSALEAAEDGRKLSQATEAIIKATGGAAGVSTKYIEDYAAELARLTGVDDELIQSGQNLLLTFKSVKNETKDGSGVFDRATRAALDLAAAGFGSVESNATQLGKALENPTKGVTALARAGVTFTDQEKEKIATLQASGNLLEAQQIVLAAVEGQVTGTAEASASATDRMSVAWEQALGTIGEALLPVIDKLLPVFVELLDKLVPAVMPVVELIADLAGMLIDALMPALEPLFPVIRELALVIGRELKVVIAQIAPLLPGLVQSFARLLTAVIPLIPPFIQDSDRDAPAATRYHSADNARGRSRDGRARTAARRRRQATSGYVGRARASDLEHRPGDKRADRPDQVGDRLGRQADRQDRPYQTAVARQDRRILGRAQSVLGPGGGRRQLVRRR